MPSVEEFFADSPSGLEIYRAVRTLVAELGVFTERVGVSQISFRRQRGFAYVWWPGRYVNSDVPAVLSLALPHRLSAARFTEVAHPAPSLWMHHLELHTASDVDAEVEAWLRQAYRQAG